MQMYMISKDDALKTTQSKHGGFSHNLSGWISVF